MKKVWLESIETIDADRLVISVFEVSELAADSLNGHALEDFHPIEYGFIRKSEFSQV